MRVQRHVGAHDTVKGGGLAVISHLRDFHGLLCPHA